jgi:lysophospholipase L1-like esterase
VTSEGSGPVVSLLSLGDSYTIGEGVAPNERWPSQLVDDLRTRGFVIDEPVIIARTGWTTDELSAAIDQSPPRRTFDLVTLLIGVNDQYRGRLPAEYAVTFRALLERSIGFAENVASRVVVISIPDWGVMPFARAHGRDPERIAAEIDEYNQINRAEASRVGAGYADVTTLSRIAGRDWQFMVGDGLHPSGLMYESWARILAPVVERAIRGETSSESIKA